MKLTNSKQASKHVVSLKSILINAIAGVIIFFNSALVQAVVIDLAGRLQMITAQSGGNQFSGVGQISGCTATPISDRVILTAAHCTQGKSSGTFWIYFADRPDVYRSVIRYIDHPNWRDSSTRTNPRSHYTYDIALGVLDAALPNYVPRYKIANFLNLSAGQTTLLIGYGASTKYSQNNAGFSGLNYGLNEIAGFYNSNLNFYTVFNPSGLTSCDKACLLAGAGVVNPSRRYGIREATIGSGDSGGPVFTSQYLDAQWTPELPGTVFQKLTSSVPEIIGVNSHSTNIYYCHDGLRDRFGNRVKCYGQRAGYVNAVAFRGWIQSHVNAVDSGSSVISATDYSFGTARPQANIAPSFSSASIPDLDRLVEFQQAGDYQTTFVINQNNLFEVDTIEMTYGGSSLVSRQITDNQASTLQVFFTGPKTIQFDWKISSEQINDSMSVYLNDELKGSISGEKDWSTMKVQIPDGTHLLRWDYTKNSSVSSGLDRAWVDHIREADDIDCDFYDVSAHAGRSIIICI